MDYYEINNGYDYDYLPYVSYYGYGYRIKIIDYYNSSVYGYSDYFYIYSNGP